MVEEENYIYLVKIEHCTVVDGEGLRTSVYCSYCSHNCKGCHNQKYQKLESGKKVHIDEIYNEILKDEICNVTFTGGDPFFQAKAFYNLAQKIKENTNKTIWIYSGFTYEQILQNIEARKLLELCDVLVDGKFILSKFDRNLKWKGSSNQRCILIKESLEKGEVVLYDEVE